MAIYIGSSKKTIRVGSSITRTLLIPELVSIVVTAPPTQTEYNPFTSFNPAGMIVTAEYDNGEKKTITDYTITNGDYLTADMTSVTISYTARGITKTTTQDIRVNHIKLDIPYSNDTFVYTGSEMAPAWTGYDSSLMTIGGSTSGTNAGTYSTNFALKDRVNYRWSDGSIAYKTVTWTIGKAQASITLDKTSVALNADKLTDTVTFSSVGMTSIMVMSSDMSVATVSMEGNVITISSVNETTGTANIIISGEVDSNYNAPVYPSIEVSAEFVEPVTVTLTGGYSGNHYGGAYAKALIGGLYYMPIPSEYATAQDNYVGFYPETVLALPIGTEIKLVAGGATSGASRNVIKLNGTSVGSMDSAAKVYNYTVTGGDVNIYLYSYDNKEVGPSMYASYGTIEITENGGGGVTKTLTSLAVTTPPTKTEYSTGEVFDPSGMVVTATYSDGSTAEVTGYTITNGDQLSADMTTVNISYTEGDVTATTTYEVRFSQPVKVTIDNYYNYGGFSVEVNGVVYQTSTPYGQPEIVEVPYGSIITYRYTIKGCECEENQGYINIYENGVLKDSLRTYSAVEYEGSFVATTNTYISVNSSSEECEGSGYDGNEGCGEDYSHASVYIREDSVGVHKVTRHSVATGSDVSITTEGSVYPLSGYVADGVVFICKVSPKVAGKIGRIVHNGVVVRQVTSDGNAVEAIYSYMLSKDVVFMTSSDDKWANIYIYDDPLPYPIPITIQSDNKDYAKIEIDSVQYDTNQVLTLEAGKVIYCRVMEWSGKAIVTLNGKTMASINNHNGSYKSYMYRANTPATIHGYYDYNNVGGRIDIVET